MVLQNCYKYFNIIASIGDIAFYFLGKKYIHDCLLKIINKKVKDDHTSILSDVLSIFQKFKK